MFDSCTFAAGIFYFCNHGCSNGVANTAGQNQWEFRGTPSPKQPFSFLGRLAINSYLALCQQESDSVACGSAWLTVHSGG